MILCLDVGNTHILGGVFDNEKLIFRFRYATHLIGTSDQLGIFLISILKNNDIDAKLIKAVSLSSVVPSYDYTIHHMVSHYFKLNCFTLRVGVKTGLNIKYKNPSEVGADRIACAIASSSIFPNKNIINVDLGTATTVDVITKNHDYLGGAILPGLRLSMEALKLNAAKLMEVNIEEPVGYLGRTTKESIQKGLYYGQFGAVKEIISGLKQEIFPNENVLVIGTGGFSQLYKDKPLFDVILPDLVLQGLKKAYEHNHA